jgi:hypothetical protein
MNPYMILMAVLAVGIATAGGYFKGEKDGSAAVYAEWDAERLKQQEAHNKALQEAIERQQRLQMGADKLRQEKDRETRDLVARNTALANSLRNRPERPTQTSTVSNPSGTGSSACTARELYREDSEVVVRIAREADEVRVALKQCYAQYDQVRQSYEQRR